MNINMQVIVVDLLETLFSYSFISNNKRDRNNLKDFYENEKLLNEILENLVYKSNKHFVIVSYNNFNNLIKRTISSKFKNVVEMDKIENIIKVRNHHKDIGLQKKIDSIPDNPFDGIIINE